LFIEYFAPASPGLQHSQVKMFDEVLQNPVYPREGFIAPRTEPGFGLVFDEKKLHHFRIL
jgi:L-alanine-DL-glutamate epimerase-like enolase superfamily enzyme